MLGLELGPERDSVMSVPQGPLNKRTNAASVACLHLVQVSSAWGCSSRVREHDHPDHALGQIHERGIYTEVRTLGSNSEGKQEQKVQLRLQTNKSDTAMR
jgi:hypothetical protein